MPGYYTVRVLETNDKEASVTLNVSMFNPDGGRIYDSVGFGLTLLDNRELKSSDLISELDRDDIYDPEWAAQYANGFVKRIVKKDLEPVRAFSEADGELLPAANITIYCTDKAWFSHLRVGEEWESYAYEVSRYYDSCDPILCGSSETKATETTDTSSHWLPAPSFLFDQGEFKLPNTVFIPKYSESSYVVNTIIELPKDDPDKIKQYHGRYIKDLDKDESGILVWNGGDNYATIFSTKDGQRGARYYYRERPIQRIALFAPRSNFQRKTSRITYDSLFKEADLMIKSAQRVGNIIRLEIVGITDLDDLNLNKAKVLKMICNNYVSTCGTTLEIDSHYPISRLLNYLGSQVNMEGRHMLNDVADGIIIDYKIISPKDSLVNFDALDLVSLIYYFEDEKWPCHSIQIEISDPEFGLQIEAVTTISKRISFTGVGPTVKKWDNPILWQDYKDLVNE